jgi:hypothetical protein
MTRIKKFWINIGFWTKLKGLIALFGAGGEITLFMTDQAAKWHIVMGVATVLVFLITQVIEDKDNNGLVDLFEKKKKPNG